MGGDMGETSNNGETGNRQQVGVGLFRSIITALETLLMQHQQLVERKLFLEDGQLSLSPLKIWLFSNSIVFRVFN